MTDKFFVDTNVLVYVRDAGEPEKQPIAAAWLNYLWKSQNGRLSLQVLQEYYNVVTRKLKPGLPTDLARADIQDLLNWEPTAVDSAVLIAAWRIEDRFGLSWWDSLIVAAAQKMECRYLLSEDLQHGQQIDALTVANPFQTAVPT